MAKKTTQRTLDSFPDCVEAKRKLSDLTQQLDDAKGELLAAEQLGHTAVEVEAESLLAGVATATVPSVAEAQRTVAVLAEAVKQQQVTVDSEQATASRAILDDHKAAHEAIISRAVKGVLAAHEALKAEVELIDTLRGQGVAARGHFRTLKCRHQHLRKALLHLNTDEFTAENEPGFEPKIAVPHTEGAGRPVPLW